MFFSVGGAVVAILDYLVALTSLEILVSFMDELTAEGTTTVSLRTCSNSVNMHLASFVIFVNFP